MNKSIAQIHKEDRFVLSSQKLFSFLIVCKSPHLVECNVTMHKKLDIHWKKKGRVMSLNSEKERFEFCGGLKKAYSVFIVFF